jgi:hypothetical protein
LPGLQAFLRLSVSLMSAMVSVSTEGPRPNARSTMRASPRMSRVRLKIAAWPLRRARITSNPAIERFFLTVNDMFLCDLDGYIRHKKRPPTLSLGQFEERFRHFLLEV